MILMHYDGSDNDDDKDGADKNPKQNLTKTLENAIQTQSWSKEKKLLMIVIKISSMEVCSIIGRKAHDAISVNPIVDVELHKSSDAVVIPTSINIADRELTSNLREPSFVATKNA